jgi:ATP-binding cassette subfamily B protein
MTAMHRSSGFRANLSLILPVFATHRRRLILGFLALFAVDLLQLQVPRIIRHVIDALAESRADHSFLLLFGLLILVLAALIALCRFCWRICIIGFSRMLEKQLRMRLFDHLLAMDRPFYSRWTTGSLMAHATNDLAAVQMACGMAMVAAADALFMATAVIWFMAAIDTRLTLIALLPMPVLAVATLILSRLMHRRFSLVQEQFGQLTEFARNCLVSISLIKGYNLEQEEEKGFARLGRQYVYNNIRVAMIQGLMHPAAALAGNASSLLVFYFGGRLVIEQTITLGALVAFFSYLAMLIWPMMAVGWVSNIWQRGLTSLARIQTLLDEQPLLTADSARAGEMSCPVPALRCENLFFTYPGSRIAALAGINLDLGPGMHGFTGRSGAGKSTLCRLMARLYPVEANTLFLCGHDIGRADPAAVRSQLSYVGQEPSLFSTSLYENILFGRPDATREEVEQAARLACIHDFIVQLDKGYATEVGERGIRLSGGQRQRIALARALLRDASILILDDALSGLDVATEKTIMDSIRNTWQGRLVLLITHRINLLALTDSITVMEDGAIVARGSHAEVAATSRLYGAMMEKQGHA